VSTKPPKSPTVEFVSGHWSIQTSDGYTADLNVNEDGSGGLSFDEGFPDEQKAPILRLAAEILEAL
jgi:hypothetical protein